MSEKLHMFVCDLCGALADSPDQALLDEWAFEHMRGHEGDLAGKPFPMREMAAVRGPLEASAVRLLAEMHRRPFMWFPAEGDPVVVT